MLYIQFFDLFSSNRLENSRSGRSYSDKNRNLNSILFWRERRDSGIQITFNCIYLN